ncbi:hypothetical protein [Asaia sp. As-1742]|uniref:hypothetical protein n=1 Tax=Asaia sp. As-1742 TaxID=2608325 RepID=UPI00141FC335|nr:hypothetical protein [Asaia sp. As-1742]NIE81804.1 hypothetical protein [Asaia sp. As-1742]
MVIFEGHEIVVHRNEHSGKYVVVTFCPSGISQHATTGFFAEPPLNKAKIPAIGITSKQDFWFISSEEAEWLPLVQKEISNFEKVVVLGCSMGGHAAIRLADALNADVVLAMSPKWSLDRNECDHIDIKYEKENFRDAMLGMGLRRRGGRARIIIAYDPHDAVDSYHAATIVEHVDQVSEVKLFHIGHGIVDFISGTINTQKIVNASLTFDIPHIVSVISKIKRSHPHTIKKIFEKFTEKKPLLCFKLLKILRDRGIDYLPLIKDSTISGRLSYHLRREGRRDESYAVLQWLDAVTLPPAVKRERDYTFRNQSRCYLLSYHGLMLVYDIREKCLRGQRLIFPETGCVPVHITLQTEDLYLKLLFDDAEYFLVIQDGKIELDRYYDRASVLRLAESRAEEWMEQFNAEMDERGYVVASRLGFIVVFSEGDVWLDSKNDRTFESFVLIPAPDTDWHDYDAPSGSEPESDAISALGSVMG